MALFRVLILCGVIVGYSFGSPTPPAYDTIIVGLGPAGSSAAAKLAEAGRKVLVLEAQDRIGGRVKTVPFGDGIVELGAEWIHGTEKSAVYELAMQNNITILPQALDPYVYFSDGSSDRADIVNNLTMFCLDVAHEQPKDPEPLGQFITRRVQEYIKTNYPSLQNDTEFIDSFLHFMDLVVDTYESSNSWNDLTTASQAEDLEGNQLMSWHTIGYKTLFDIILNTYNNGPGYPTLEIKLNTEVTNIQWPQDPKDSVVVTVKDGTTYTAKTVIVTVSLGVLKERYQTLFSPPLPEEKTRAIEAISFGACTKTILRFATVPWDPTGFYSFLWRSADKASVSEEDKWILYMDGAGAPMASNTTLVLWTCGDAAIRVEQLPEDVVKTKVMEVIRRFMGATMTIPEPVEIMRSNWFSNPFTRGCYSYDNVQTPQHPTARADLARPLNDSNGAPRVLFAGEATNTKHYSTVHGAVETGRRMAAMLLLRTASEK